MAAEIEWPRVAIETGLSLLSAIGGLLVGIWRWGRRSAQHDQKIKDDYDAKINVLRSAIMDTDKAAEDRLHLLVEQFKESFAGLRRQIDDERLHTEQTFLRKDDFRDFREEYREDMRDLKHSIAGITRLKP